MKLLKIKEYDNLEKYYSLEKTYYKGGNPIKKIGKEIGKGIGGIGKTAKNIVGGLTGGAIGKNPQEDLLRQQREEADRQAREAAERQRLAIEAENRRRAEERARAEAEAKAKAEAEARRQAELERQRKAEEDYRNKVKTDTENMQREIDGLQNKQQGTNLTDKPQTTVDFSKSLKLNKDRDEDKLKKIFKTGR